MTILAVQDPSFRVAQPSDIPAANAIKELLFPGDPHTYAENILYATTRNMVAVSNNEVIGYASALTEGQNPEGRAMWQRIRPYIGFIGIHPAYQNRGLGSQLLLQVCGYIFHTTSADYAYLECSPQLAHFYAKSGFTELPALEVEAMFGANPSNSSVCRIERAAVIS